MNTKNLSGKIALITGASRGIGKAVMQRFAREGAHVIGVARNEMLLQEFDDELKKEGIGATFVPLDLKEYDKVDLLAAHIAQRFGRLDILVGNAAILGSLTPLSHLEPKTWQQVMDINVTANWRLLKVFDGLLKNSEAGRAIFVTSSVAQNPLAYWGAYAASKSALETLVETYALENKITNVKANIVDPGVVRTDMRAQGFPGEKPEKHPFPE